MAIVSFKTVGSSAKFGPSKTISVNSVLESSQRYFVETTSESFEVAATRCNQKKIVDIQLDKGMTKADFKNLLGQIPLLFGVDYDVNLVQKTLNGARVIAGKVNFDFR